MELMILPLGETRCRLWNNGGTIFCSKTGISLLNSAPIQTTNSGSSSYGIINFPYNNAVNNFQFTPYNIVGPESPALEMVLV